MHWWGGGISICAMVPCSHHRQPTGGRSASLAWPLGFGGGTGEGGNSHGLDQGLLLSIYLMDHGKLEIIGWLDGYIIHGYI